jgi:succinate dehydrogenase / fumarate reductase, flavoprotein subunit
MKADVLIIGAGAAGLRTAIELAERGVACLVLGKSRHGDAHTRMAAGGINAVLNSLDADDRWDIHAADTIREGGFLCQPSAVELLAREAPARIEELAAWGCPFDRTDDGRIDQRYFGAQSFRRTCFVGDVTGEAVLETLVRRAEHLAVPFRENIFVTRILVAGPASGPGPTTGAGAVTGALAIDLDTGERLHLRSSTIVLAAGGCTSLYRRNSSRDGENTGDAMALAYDAGAELRDMEMVQFHPTGMIHPPAMRGRLVTEAVRGEGGRLFNARGERFMQRYAPEQMELAARDVVARANHAEIRAGRGTTNGGVLLDISHQDPSLIRDRLPEIYHQFLDQGIDITREPVEVAPTAHYPMGGVKVDAATGATRVEGLYAIGEAASGVHGANRLGGNSLAETVVFGRLTGAHIAEHKAAHGTPPAPPDDAVLSAHTAAHAPGDTYPRDPRPELIDRLRNLMDEYAGIMRTGAGLRSALRDLDDIGRQARQADSRRRPGRQRQPGPQRQAGPRREPDHRHHQGRPEPRDAQALALPFMLLTAEAILRAALLRDESRGAHFREDAPDTRDDWQRNIICERGADGAMALRSEPVPPTSSAIQRALDEHRALDYHLLE